MKPIVIGIVMACVWLHGAVWGHDIVSQKAEFIQERDMNYCKEVVSKFSNKLIRIPYQKSARLTGKITIYSGRR